MGRVSFIADEKLLSHLLELSKLGGFIPGLVIGQCSSQKDHVIYLARTPLPEFPSKKDDTQTSLPSGDNVDLNHKKLTNFMDIEENWMTAHSRTVTRMLPGGTWILGIFIVGSEDIFQNKNCANKVSSLISFVYNCTKSNPFLHGQPPNKNQVVFFFNSLTKKYLCRVYELESLNIACKSADWKFQPNPTSWFCINCSYNLGKFSPFYLTEETSKRPLKMKLQDILKAVSENIDKSLCTIDGQFRDDTETLLEVKQKIETKIKLTDEEGKKKKKIKQKDENSFTANLYVLQEGRKDEEDINVQFLETVCNLECKGSLFSKVFLNSKATVEDAVKAVKEDIIRSWAARLEMHWDTCEEEDSSHFNEKGGKENKEVHMLPRRVLCRLPQSEIFVSEYLFPEEGATDALASIEEQLGFRAEPKDLLQNFERQSDPNSSESNTNPEISASTEVPQSYLGSTNQRRNINIMVIGVVVAFFVFLISIAVQVSR